MQHAMIERVWFKNFRALRDVQVGLSPLIGLPGLPLQPAGKFAGSVAGPNLDRRIRLTSPSTVHSMRSSLDSEEFQGTPTLSG